MNIVGISAYYHDSAAALVRDGEIVAAAQEERFTRKKGDHRFPSRSLDYVLKAGGTSIGDVDYLVFYDKPLTKFERLLSTYVSYAPSGIRSFIKAMPLWLKEKLHMPREIRKLSGFEGKILFAQHHESHAASAFYPSPFEEAAIICFDGVGEWATTSVWIGRGNRIELKKQINFPHSLGLLYAAFTYYTGFKVNSGEYKVMGLAPYGQPVFADTIRKHLIDIRDDGSFRMNLDYFNYAQGLTMTSEKFHRLFGGPPREPETLLTQRDLDLAASIQEVCEEVMLKIARNVAIETKQRNLCLAGGVALNCVGNGKILRDGSFDDLWIQPAAGDAGGSLGAALAVWNQYLECGGHAALGPKKEAMCGAYLGPSFTQSEIETYLRSQTAPYKIVDDAELLPKLAQFIAAGKIVGWFNGRMEFGPRALGARSILGDPRSPRMQAQMNIKIKFREGFRPFAPSVLRDKVHEYFELDTDSPYMLLVAPVKTERQIPMDTKADALWGIDKLNVVRSDIPAVTHIDYSARIQTVSRDTSPDYYDLIHEFECLTGCAVLVNTSFNVRGEPIVCSPADAYRCFMRTHLDHLVLGPYLLDKPGQPEFKESGNWKQEFQLD